MALYSVENSLKLMTIGDAALLGIIQGITEFLPISSSGHLIIFEDWLNLPLASLKSFDVAVHVGTLLSILIYFKNDIFALIKGLLAAIAGKTTNEHLFGATPLNFIGFLIVGTLPAVIVGLSLESEIDAFFRNGHNVAYAFLYTAALFLFVEYGLKNKKSKKLNYWGSLLIGIFQAIAIVPGISRSGSTIGAGLMAGLERKESAHFSFLLAIPALLGAGILTSVKIFEGGADVVLLPWSVYATGILLSGISGYIAIYLLMKFLKTHSLAWFSLYLIILSAYILS